MVTQRYGSAKVLKVSHGGRSGRDNGKILIKLVQKHMMEEKSVNSKLSYRSETASLEY